MSGKNHSRHRGHKDWSLLYKLNLGTCVGIISQPENHSVEESDQPDGILSKRKSLSCGGSRRLSPYLGWSANLSARRAQALRPYSNGFCPQCRGELRSPKRYIIKAQVPYHTKNKRTNHLLIYIDRIGCFHKKSSWKIFWSSVDLGVH
jgi:hypothetical protein